MVLLDMSLIFMIHRNSRENDLYKQACNAYSVLFYSLEGIVINYRFVKVLFVFFTLIFAAFGCSDDFVQETELRFFLTDAATVVSVNGVSLPSSSVVPIVANNVLSIDVSGSDSTELLIQGDVDFFVVGVDLHTDAQFYDYMGLYVVKDNYIRFFLDKSSYYSGHFTVTLEVTLR